MRTYPLRDEDIVPGEWRHMSQVCPIHRICMHAYPLGSNGGQAGALGCVQCMRDEQREHRAAHFAAHTGTLGDLPHGPLQLPPSDGGPRLPTDAAERKAVPLAAVLDYFPDALAEIARVIAQGQRQHNTSAWARSKSTDQADCLLRHFLERGSDDVDGLPHSAKVAWRALALLQIELEAARGLPISRGSVP